jgi:hypothetical protein
LTTIVSLIGVYDADGGLRGELAYLAGKARGHHCSLCDITHSPVRRRTAWVDYVESLPVPFAVVHRNERTPDVTAATAGREPCVVAECDDGRLVMLLSDEQIQQSGDVAGLARSIEQAAKQAGLMWPLAGLLPPR